jgi:hypothetical protein
MRGLFGWMCFAGHTLPYAPVFCQALPILEHQTMKRVLLTVIGAALAMLPAANSMAQSDGRIISPASVGQISYGYYAAPQGPTGGATTETPATEQASEKTATNDNYAGEAESTCRWCRCGALSDPWTLPQPEGLKNHNVTIGGWIDTGIYGNQYGAPSNGPVGLRNVGDGWTVDQLWLFAERKTDTQGCGWDIGGRIDYIFGADGPDTQCFGDRTWDFGWNSSRDYGSAIPQLYVEIAYNDWRVKLGHFYTLIGYEVVQATGNFFYSHSYSHTFGEPFTHTGAIASYASSDNVTWYGGWVNGWDQGFEGADDGSMFHGGVALTLSEKATVGWYCTAGKFGSGNAFPGAAIGDLYDNSLVFTYKLSDKWTYVLEHDLGANYNTGGNDSQWYEVANYLMYKVNDCLSYGGRFEWFQDPQGARVSAGSRGDYCSLSGGVNWKPHANVTIRPELRYDWFHSFAGSTSNPFDNGDASRQLSGGVDLVFTY